MDLRKLGVLAACLALPVSALNRGLAPRWAPARETDRAELVEKTATGVSPVPTSSPELAAMELFKRDYSLPSDYCGWYADYKSASYTCGRIGASCINIGDYRGCCIGTGSSCASTFYTTCIDRTDLTVSSTCGQGTICCSGTDYPACGTILFSSSAHPSDTYTIVDCYSAGMGTTYRMQDYQPFTSTTTTSSRSTPTPDPTTSPIPLPTPTETKAASKKTPVGPIVGGTIGGIAVIGLIILGILYLYRWRPAASSSAAAAATSAAAAAPAGGAPPGNQSYPQDPNMQYHQQQMSPGPQMGQMSPGPQLYPSQTGTPSTYDPRFSYVQGYQNSGSYPTPMGSPPMHSGSPTTGGMMSTPSPDPSKMAESSTSPVQQQFAMEAPARNPVGMGNNAAELAG